jgi:hypothetical protein
LEPKSGVVLRIPDISGPYRTSPALWAQDKSGTPDKFGIYWTSPVCRVMYRFCDLSFIVSLIDPVLLPLCLSSHWDHRYPIGWCAHHLLVRVHFWGLLSGYRPNLTEGFNQLPFTPPPVASLGSSIGIRAG